MKAYSSALEKHPLLTKCLSAGTLFSLGDAVTQLVFDVKKQFNLQRNINFFVCGSVYMAPCLHIWYCKVLPKIAYKCFKDMSKTMTVFGKMAFDQLLFAPVMLTGFFVFNGLLVEKRLSGLRSGIDLARDRLWSTLVAGWKIWPFATTIIFWFVPIHYQVLSINFVGLFWNMFLSYITNKK